MELNFHDMDWLLEKDKPHGLKPLDIEDMGMALRDEEGSDELMHQHAQLHDFETWAGNKGSKIGGAELTPIDHLEVGVRGEEE
jgi:hypothetical protein